MSVGKIDLDQLLRQMANRDTPWTEAKVQSQLHALLLAAPLALKEDDLDLQKITLEQQAGQRRASTSKQASASSRSSATFASATYAQKPRSNSPAT